MSTKEKEKDYGYDNSMHHLIQLKVPPPSLIALRDELALPGNKDISDYAKEGNSFEDCVGRIALKLDIILDGIYDGAELCDVLVTALRKRKESGLNPHFRDPRLVAAEIVETEGEIEVKTTGADMAALEEKPIALLDENGNPLTPVEYLHTCHWPGCERIVDPAMWGCKYHWFALPASLRARIWGVYESGQEITKRPSKAYIEVTKQVLQWILTRSSIYRMEIYQMELKQKEKDKDSEAKREGTKLA